MAGPIDPTEIGKLLEWCESSNHPRVRHDWPTKLRLVLEHGTLRSASVAAGMGDHSALSTTISRIRALYAGSDRRPHLGDAQPPGFSIKGVSSHRKVTYEDGTEGRQWIKTDRDREEQAQQLESYLDALCAKVEGKAKPVKAPKLSNADLLSVYPWGDPHVGMLAWGPEAGEDFDVGIARRDLVNATQILADASAPSEQALLLSLGDLFHADNQAGMTSRSGNVLDVDTRLGKVTEAVEDIATACIEVLLAKHKTVLAKFVRGNHDDVMSFCLARILAAYYRNEPRVQIDTSPSDFYYLRHGKTLLASTHGHGPKPNDLPGIMAHDRPTDWGEAAHRYWLTGHIHNKQMMEFPGVVWESFRNLAPNDAWHQGKGYRSGRDAYCVVYHREHGEIMRHRADIQRVRATP